MSFMWNKYRCIIYIRSIRWCYILDFINKVDKSITQEMEVILNKYENKKIETSKCIKKVRNVF